VAERGRISVRLFRLGASGTIHSHDHVGAFGLLAGSSLHATYRFTPDGDADGPIVTGDLALERFEELKPGDVRAIPSTQMRHLLTGIAADTTIVRIVLPVAGASAYAHLPPRAAYDVDFVRPDAPRDEQLATAFAARGMTAAWEEAIAEDAWRENALAWSEDMGDEEHRFLLALLALAPDRDTVFRTLAARSQCDPVAVVLRFIDQLARQADDGAIHLLGIEIPPDMKHELRTVVRARMRGDRARDERWAELDKTLFRNLFVSTNNELGVHR
jgi:hypothetical protein